MKQGHWNRYFEAVFSAFLLWNNNREARPTPMVAVDYELGKKEVREWQRKYLFRWMALR